MLLNPLTLSLLVWTSCSESRNTTSRNTSFSKTSGCGKTTRSDGNGTSKTRKSLLSWKLDNVVTLESMLDESERTSHSPHLIMNWSRKKVYVAPPTR